MGEILRTEGLTRDFKSGAEIIHVLKNISISLEAGKLTILRGRSGSGKTTLINLLGALDRPDKGKIIFCGNNITTAAESLKNELRCKRMGFVFQSVALLSMMSAYENVEFGLRVAGFNAKERKIRAEECLGLVGLSKRMNHRPYELSGGEQQRVAIARAIAHKPDIVFADEPTAELDTHMGLQVVKLFKSLVEKQGLTVVMTTHDPSMIDIADYVLTLEAGEFMAIIGNSGSGKSTLLNMLGGLDRPSAGKLLVDGRDMLKFNDSQLIKYKRDTVGFVWQNNARNLIPYMSAQENVELSLMLTGKVGRRFKALQLLGMVGLLGRRNNRLNQLSGGEQQRKELISKFISQVSS